MIKAKTSKITLFEALLIYMVALYSPYIRFVTGTSIADAHQAAWLVHLCSTIIYIPLLFVLYKITKKYEGQSLHDIFCRIFGKPVGKSLCVIYIIWMFVLLGLYIKYAAEKVVTSSFVGTDINLIMFLLISTAGVMLRWGLPVLSRMNKVIFAFLLTQFIIVMVFIFFNFDVQHITPISTLDIGPAFQSIKYPLTVSAYVTLIFIFNDQIQHGKKSLGKFSFTAVFLTISGTLIILAVLGMFGYKLAEKLTFPLLTAVENISVFGATAGLDSLFISIWMIAEYVTISIFAYGIVRLIKNLFHLKNEVPVLTAVLGFSFFFAIYICTDVFELIVFSREVAPYFNLSLFVGIPFILFITAKARKLL